MKSVDPLLRKMHVDTMFDYSFQSLLDPVEIPAFQTWNTYSKHGHH